MAYASVAQAELSPTLPEITSPPLSLGFDYSGHGDSSADVQDRPRVASILKSLSSNQSYEMVEDDDYEEPMRTPMGLALNMDVPSYAPQSNVVAADSPEPPMRTASISRHLPLNHPTPDLQALQGALVKNVERLEESAERLSMTSSLEDELHKMRQDQKRMERQSSAPNPSDHILRPAAQRQFSAGSWSNSILGVNQTARTGGYSPGGYITSPTGSIHSSSWSVPHQLDRNSSKGSRTDRSLPEPVLEGRPLEFASSPRPAVTVVPSRGVTVASTNVAQESLQVERPLTSASNDTFCQAESAFHDFDGVHYNTNFSLGRGDSLSRRISLRQPPLARDSKAYREAQPGEKMIFYPAPVPVMLNLPKRLSQANFGEREKRRLQGISGIPGDMRKSAAWLVDQDSTHAHASKPSLNLPPQLRASAFFEQPSVTHNLQLKNGSAIQTLDSILDAAAYAPVSAFTDHPIAGQLGKEVYGSRSDARKSMQLQDDKAKKRRSSLSNLLKTKRSMSGSRLGRTRSRESRDMLDIDGNASGDDLDRAAAASIAPDDDEAPEDADEDDDDDLPPGYSAAPTTLLAELQMRKEQQKMRNRTAADAFPNGMHSTLLELDAVTQLQQKARKTKHVTLAWEDHDEATRKNFDDDDVPLGLLYPEKDRARHDNIHRPVGLLERREIEDNEPLSRRRARLRGEPLHPPKSDVQTQIEEPSRAPVIEDVPGLTHEVVEEEDETLAQRAARIKREQEKGTGGRFAEELTSELGLNVSKAPETSKTPDVEETLGQRRKRLQQEALKKGASSSNPVQLGSMHNLASILQAHPVGIRQVSNESNRPTTQRAQTLGLPLPYSTMESLQSQQGMNWQLNRQNSAFVNGAYGNFYQQNSPYMNPGFGASASAMYGAPIPMYMQQQMGTYGYGNQPYVQDPMSGPPLDPKQRQKIDLWRQSVVQ